MSSPPLPEGIPDDAIHRAANQLHSLAIHLLRAVRTVDPESGLSPERASLLSVLVYGGTRAVGELARAEQLTPPAITRTVRALEEEGLVRRRRDPDDQRRVLVEPTEAGRRRMERARARRIERLAPALEPLPEVELAHLKIALELVRDVVGRLAEEGEEAR